MPKQKSRIFNKDSNQLTVMSTGGSSRIKEGLELVLQRISSSAPPFETAYKKIAIVTDNDDESTVQDIIRSISGLLSNYSITIDGAMKDKDWVTCKLVTAVGIEFEFQLLLLVIPFTHQGAIETFLLDAIANKDQYDAEIIKKSKEFVSDSDKEARYLTKRSYKTKAEFAAFFCIRTPAEAYSERHNIMKTGINWAEYTLIQRDFAKLADL